MENAITAGLSRQIVLMRALEATANNVANQTTAGFKAEHVAFREYLARVPADRDSDVSLVFDPDSYADFSPGGLEQTHNALDFAIDGDGFFAVESVEGVLYTRDGRFSTNEVGELVTRDGGRVLDPAGAPILLDVEAGPPLLSPDGALLQNGVPVAALGVFEFDDPRALERRGDNRFRTTGEAKPAAAPRLSQGFIETSNVEAVAAMTDLVEINRAYEQAARVVETADELAREAVRRLSENA
ncbi:MAG: flagellar basal-body rod protein FlgF [Parvularculaceae bacterium]